jgi:hypothetical protein
LLLASAPEHRTPLRFRLAFASSPCSFADRHGSPAVDHRGGPTAVEPFDGDRVRLERARERWPARAERGRAACSVDSPAGDGSGAQPAARLGGQLRPTSRTWLRHAGEPLPVRAVLPLLGGVAQFHPERNLVGGYLRRRLRGVPGDPDELGSLGPPLPRGAAHARHTGAAGASRGAGRWHDDLAVGVAMGTLHSLHDDLQQRRMGAGVVLPPQRRARPPPFTGKVLKEKADSWWHDLSPSSRQDRLESAYSR